MAEVRVVHAQYMCLERRGLLTRVGRFPTPAVIVKSTCLITVSAEAVRQSDHLQEFIAIT